jgi:dTDP-4-dehydrorhamnose reductase
MPEPHPAGRGLPALWAGVECTVNRVGDRYVDQCEKNGHGSRLDDLRLFFELGIERVRYPFLWEKMAPESLDAIDWSWGDRRLPELQRLGIKPIAGLLHHGSGPRYTSLLDPAFPGKLAKFAGKVAERYPEIDAYTPVNEPLTTARFSGLYGVWYPHAKDDRSFCRALYHQVRGTILAMAEIRKTRPDAKLVQTEDLGRASSTRRLAYQVAFENERRWLSFDLLAGKVEPAHPLYGYLLRSGISARELAWLVEHPTPPDILGINHYLLSSRFLDHRYTLYPKPFRGGNGRHRYADVGAVDTGAAELPSPESILKEVWARYGSPIAVTEVHVSGPREAQLQWFREVWEAAKKTRDEGADVVAVTAWSLLGTYDWNTLCTSCNHFYEPGVFDVRSAKPRPTAVAKMIRSLAKEAKFEHPVLEQKGWWHHPERARFAPEFLPKHPSRPRTRPILITGATGTLGRAFARVCAARGLSYELVGRSEMDIADPASVRTAIAHVKPWAVINAAGYVRVDDAEDEHERCFRENVSGPEILAREARRKEIPLLSFSSDLVFDGGNTIPYLESNPVSPLNVYGHSKAESERRILGENSRAFVVRTSSFFGPWDEYNFVTGVLRTLATGGTVRAASDLTVSPTYVPDLVHASLDLLIDGEVGIAHLTNSGGTTWHGFAETAFASASKIQDYATGSRGSRELIVATNSKEMGYRAKRPKFTAMGSERVAILPPFEEALERFLREVQVPLRTNRGLEALAGAPPFERSVRSEVLPAG